MYVYVCVCVCVAVVHVSALSPLHASAHETGKDGHDHFLVDLHQVLGQSVHLGSDLPRHGDSIPGIRSQHHNSGPFKQRQVSLKTKKKHFGQIFLKPNFFLKRSGKNCEVL